jgi:hypothetical protein
MIMLFTCDNSNRRRYNFIPSFFELCCESSRFETAFVPHKIHDTFAQVDYSTITTTVVEPLLKKGVVVAATVAGNLFCQQSGFR